MIEFTISPGQPTYQIIDVRDGCPQVEYLSTVDELRADMARISRQGWTCEPVAVSRVE